MSPDALSSRRRLLLGSLAGATAGWLASRLPAEDRPAITRPRATSGDTVSEPDWNERLTITVGPQDADLVGTTDKVLQAAVDYVARLGGGTVKILPGTYRLRNSVFLASKVRLLGSGSDSILIKEPSEVAKLAEDSDWFDQEITLEGGGGFRVGDGICLRTKKPDGGGRDVLKRTLVAKDGNRFKLDRALRENFWLMGGATCASLFPILSGENIADLAIENLALDGNKERNENLDGNYAGCIFLQDCSRVAIRGVEARNYNGDGVSWQVCHDVTVENCHSHDHAGLGLHPGSGSQRPTIKSNRLERNDIGLFFCWGVKYGLAQGNQISDNRSYGVSIGHRDTENLIVDNDVVRSGKVGVLFRPERGKDFAPHRNRVERNRIVDSGPESGTAVDVQGETQEVAIVGNDIRESRGAAQRIGIRLGKSTKQIKVEENRFAGLMKEVEDLR
ncbi:MAG TPA: right-handed parallel beta-helix repeat-containing protein [Pirellulaceae bacterium]|nr:right-handed parallel beta-helix repeat-containing protein [Pirellulaceae bacterium]